MPNNNNTISRPVTGMFRDIHAMQMEEGQYEYMLNGAIENFDGNGPIMVQNESSNILCTGFPQGFYVVGFANIVEQKRILWLVVNPETGYSGFGETRNYDACKDAGEDSYFNGGCEDCPSLKLNEKNPLEKITQTPCCTFTMIQSGTCLSLNRSYPVLSIEYKIVDCGIEVAFTDDLNGLRRIVFVYQNDDVNQGLIIDPSFYEIIGFEDEPCEIPIYGPNLDCNKLKLQPNALTPCIEFEALVPGGNNRAGVYQFLIAFAEQSYHASYKP